ncbi:SDR family NAD(P)-dependent oxidoreductase [Tamlana flava]|uniref:SDR family NAD(P)-dependent oxidoreductase n=1 Tax=Tamlana flava TaxID=3158572 RepID=UPI00351BC2D5
MKPVHNTRQIQNWLITEIAKIIDLTPGKIDIHKPFNEYGLSSVDVVSLSGELEQFLGRRLSPTLAYEYPDIATLTEYLSNDNLPDNQIEKPLRETDEPIAIIGMGCRFPGANNPDEFWDLLRNGVDKISEVPSKRWDKDAFYHHDPSTPGKSVSSWGGFMDDIDQFDPFFFGISPKEAKDMDPQQRLLMELSFETLDDAGLTKDEIADTRTGVFIGISVNEYSKFQLDDPLRISNLSGTGSALSIAANRISYYYNLRGPSMAIDTACSSSLAACHIACHSIRSGESKMALVGGANLILSPAHSIAFTKAGVLAPDGKCKTFDASANGYVRGEGVGLVLLKSLTEALADGNKVYAVIRGSAMNQDGRTNGLMAPNQISQELMLKEAYKNARVHPSEVQYIEAHGTGTLLGDSIEATAIGNVIGKEHSNGKCQIGSVKTNIGHLEAAAGIAGLIKVVLSIQNRSIPPSLNFQNPNPHVDFDNLNLSVNDELGTWPDSSKPLTAGVSSFGFGGSNVHLVVTEFNPSIKKESKRDLSSGGKIHVLPISAKDEHSLNSLVNNMLDLIISDSDFPLKEICLAACKRRSSSNHRLIAMGSSHDEMVDRLRDYLNEEPHFNMQEGLTPDQLPKIVFVFSGQGGHWLGMGRELIELEPLFYESIKQVSFIIQEFYGWSVLDVLLDDTTKGVVNQIDRIQPAIFAIQVALVDLLKSLGIEPDAVVGHSMGEVAAAHISGILSLEEAVKIVCTRSEMLTKLEEKGCMMITELTPEQAAKCLEGYENAISVAAVNGPNSTVLSGDPYKMQEIMEKLEQKNLFCKLVKVNVASHSPQIDILKDDMIGALKEIRPQPPVIPIYSSVTGSEGSDLQFDSDYWFFNLRAPVLFYDTIDLLIKDEHSVFIEIGPHPVLLGSIQQSANQSGAEISLLPTLRREEGELEVFMRTISSLYIAGFSIEWDTFYGKSNVYVKLPPVTWNHERFWIDYKGRMRAYSSLDKNTHPFLGSRISLAIAPDNFIWQNTINTDCINYLKDHIIFENVIFPASGYIEIGLQCIHELGLSESHILVDVSFIENLILNSEIDYTLQISMSPDKNGAYNLQIHSRSDDSSWTLNASASIEKSRSDFKSDYPKLSEEVIEKCHQLSNGSEFYNSMAERGLDYGPNLRGVQGVWESDGKIIGSTELLQSLHCNSDEYRFHPALLDSCLQVIAGSEMSVLNNDLYLPVSSKKILYYGQPSHSLWTEVIIMASNGPNTDMIEADFNIFDQDFRLIAQIQGLVLKRIRKLKSKGIFKDDIWFYTTDWVKEDIKSALSNLVKEKRNWLILSDDQGYGDNLKSMLESNGDHCQMLYAKEVIEQLNEYENESFLQDLIEKAIVTANSPLFGIVHLWSLSIPTWEESENPKNLLYDLGCYSILHLVQALSRQFKGSPNLWMVSQGVHASGSDFQVNLEQSTLWGLCKTVGFEIPELKCVRIDLDPDSSIEDSVRSLRNRILLDDKEDQICFRLGQSYVQRIFPFYLKPIEDIPEKSIKAEHSYLITGGLGSLGLETAKWLVKKGAKNLILVSRTELSESSKAVIEYFMESGVHIMIRQVDVREKKEVELLIEEINASLPQLKGIIHAAGVLDDAPLLDISTIQMKRVMQPKVEGSWNLHESTLQLDLDFFILYSSAVSVLGSPGQGNYSAASTYLDCLAHYRRTIGLPAISINWGPWADVGLAVEATEKMIDQGKSTEHLVKMIKIDQGFEVLDLLLKESLPQITVLPFDLKYLLELYPLAAAMPFFKNVRESDTHVAKLYARPKLNHKYVAPKNEIEHKMVKLWQQTLHIDRVGIHDSFFELGGDSVLAAQILSKVRKTYGIDIDPKDAFQYFTIERIAEMIEMEIIKQIEAMSEEEAQSHLLKKDK